jgi:hypothetical protein
VCINCDRLKRPCEGYRRGEITFLNENWKSHGISSSASSGDSPAAAKSAEGSCYRIAGESASTTRRDMKGAIEGTTKRSQRDGVSSAGKELSESTKLVKPLVTLAPHKMSIYITFFLAQFSTGNCNAVGERMVYERDDFILARFRRMWHHHTGGGEFNDTSQQRERSDGPLFPAVEGLIKAYFAKRHSDISLLRDGILANSTALKRMREQINHMDASPVVYEEWEDTIFACLVLGLYEVRRETAVQTISNCTWVLDREMLTKSGLVGLEFLFYELAGTLPRAG